MPPTRRGHDEEEEEESIHGDVDDDVKKPPTAAASKKKKEEDSNDVALTSVVPTTTRRTSRRVKEAMDRKKKAEDVVAKAATAAEATAASTTSRDDGDDDGVGGGKKETAENNNMKKPPQSKPPEQQQVYPIGTRIRKYYIEIESNQTKLYHAKVIKFEYNPLKDKKEYYIKWEETSEEEFVSHNFVKVNGISDDPKILFRHYFNNHQPITIRPKDKVCIPSGLEQIMLNGGRGFLEDLKVVPDMMRCTDSEVQSGTPKNPIYGTMDAYALQYLLLNSMYGAIQHWIPQSRLLDYPNNVAAPSRRRFGSKFWRMIIDINPDALSYKVPKFGWNTLGLLIHTVLLPISKLMTTTIGYNVESDRARRRVTSNVKASMIRTLLEYPRFKEMLLFDGGDDIPLDDDNNVTTTGAPIDWFFKYGTETQITAILNSSRNATGWFLLQYFSGRLAITTYRRPAIPSSSSQVLKFALNLAETKYEGIYHDKDLYFLNNNNFGVAAAAAASLRPAKIQRRGKNKNDSPVKGATNASLSSFHDDRTMAEEVLYQLRGDGTKLFPSFLDVLMKSMKHPGRTSTESSSIGIDRNEKSTGIPASGTTRAMDMDEEVNPILSNLFFIALQLGHPWEDVIKHILINSNNPNLDSMYEPKEGLPPFLVAAVAAAPRDDENNKELSSVNNTFELLRTRPVIIKQLLSH